MVDPALKPIANRELWRGRECVGAAVMELQIIPQLPREDRQAMARRLFHNLTPFIQLQEANAYALGYESWREPFAELASVMTELRDDARELF